MLNKIDLPGAEPERVKREIEEVIGLDCSDAIMASAKQACARVPAPRPPLPPSPCAPAGCATLREGAGQLPALAPRRAPRPAEQP